MVVYSDSKQVGIQVQGGSVFQVYIEHSSLRRTNVGFLQGGFEM